MQLMKRFKTLLLFYPDASILCPSPDGVSLQGWIDRELLPRAAGVAYDRLAVHWTAEVAPRLSVIPFAKHPIVMLSIWHSAVTYDANIVDNEILAAFADLSVNHEVYRVDESLPVVYEQDWAAGSPTPGIGLLTLFRRAEGLSHERFVQIWHGEHTPLSLRIHPLWKYERNLVQEKLFGVSPERYWHGIVAEHFRTRADLMDLRRFFGGTRSMLPNMLRVARHIKTFLDTATLETYLVSERLL
jgi:hypothetical protein